MKEYKVVTQENWTVGKMGPSATETTLNELAKQGWHLISTSNVAFKSAIGGEKQHLTMFLERDLK